MLTENQKNKIAELININHSDTYIFNSLDIDYILNSDIEDIEDLNEKFTEYIQEHELLYCSDCIDFLKENDTSLRESLEIAEEYGYTPKNLSSEILATLLIQKYMFDELHELIQDIENEDII